MEYDDLSNDSVDRDDLRRAVQTAYQDAKRYDEDYLAPARLQNQSYYNGSPLGNEEEGRSDIVLTEVRDTILAMMPSLVRVFASTDKLFEYIPFGPEDVEVAEQATDYVTHVVLQQDNSAYTLFHSLIKDALIAKVGVAKWWWDTTEVVTEESYTGLSLPAAAMLAQDPEVSVLSMSVEQGAQAGMLPPILQQFMQPQQPMMPPDAGMAPAMPGPMPPAPAAASMPMEQPEVTVAMRVRRTKRTGKACVQAVPPEEFLIARTARDVQTSPYVAHRTLKTVSDLVAMGYDRDVIEDNAGDTEWDISSDTSEQELRNPGLDQFSDLGTDKSMRRVLYVESFIRYDADDDGVAELHRVCSVGDSCEVLHDEIVDEIPFALFCPDPVPHAAIGNSIAEQVLDIQFTKSTILRNTLDSLAQSIHPRTVVVEQSVNLDDVLNTEVGAVIRAKQPGMIQTLDIPFNGQFTLPLMEYFDSVRTARTGVNRSTLLDADALQSTSANAVAATVSAAAERTEMVARTLAETGMKPLARGILRLVTRNQDRPRMVKLRNKWVEMDLRNAPDMDVSVNTAVGRGNEAQKLGFLAQIMAKQEQILQQLGPQNPIVGLQEWQNTVSDMAILMGFKDATKYFKQIPPGWQPPQQQQQMDPNQLLAQVEQQKIMADIEIQKAKLELEREKMMLEDDRKRDESEMARALKTAEIEARYGAQVDEARMRMETERDRFAQQEATKAWQHMNPAPAAPAPDPMMAPEMGGPPPSMPDAQPQAPTDMPPGALGDMGMNGPSL